MTLRTGILAEKVGMSRLLTENEGHVPVTLLRLVSCQVVGHKQEEKDGYNALQVAYGQVKKSKVSKAMLGFYAKQNCEPKKSIKEFRIDPENMMEIGTNLDLNLFEEGQYVDVTGRTIGKGFAGVMKKYNFRGLRASHGVSISHRSQGSTGQRQDPGRVFKGKKMAGHMGQKKVTVQSLKIAHIDKDLGLICIKGAVPGSKGTMVVLKDAVKKKAK